MSITIQNILARANRDIKFVSRHSKKLRAPQTLLNLVVRNSKEPNNTISDSESAVVGVPNKNFRSLSSKNGGVRVFVLGIIYC